MGKRKIEIKKIDEKEKRMVTFSKRRQGLFKKAAELCRLCDAKIAIIVLSPAGKPFTFSHPSIDDVIHRFLTGTTKEEEVLKNKKRVGGGGGFWWDNINMEELDSNEKLQAMKNALLNLKENVAMRIEKLKSLSASTSSSSSTARAGATSTTTATEDRSLYLTEGDDFHWPSNDEIAKLDELSKFRKDILQRPPLFNIDQTEMFFPGLGRRMN